MTCKVTVQKNTFSESLAIVGRAVGSRSNLPILSNILLSKDGDQLRLSATDLTLGVTAGLPEWYKQRITERMSDE